MNSVGDTLRCSIPLLLVLIFVFQVEGRAAGRLHRTKRQEQTDFKCPKADGLFADPETCKKFYICAGHYPFSQNCPSSLYFDDIKKFCTRKTKQLACGPVETPETEAPPTPDPHLPNECDPSACVLPDCFCSSDGTRIPGGLEPSETPQMILLSFDGAVNSLNFDHYRKLLNKSRTNPNGCPIKGTFFVSHEYTSHFHLQKFFADGHEVAVHSISNRSPEEWWAKASYEDYAEEMVGQREILHKFANISRESLLGMRVPYLHPGGNDMMAVAYDFDFAYDSSIIVPMSHTPVWPYTLDYRIPHKCMQGTCPTKSFPGLWEIPLNTLFSEDGTGGMCSLADQCVFQENDDESVEQFLKDNFKRHYNVNRAPLGLYFHVNWFNDRNKTNVLLNFVDDIRTKHRDVWFVTMQELISWMRNPTKAANLNSFAPWACEKRENSCNIPKSCEVPLAMEGYTEMRYMQTCAKCPVKYPWVGNFEGSAEGYKIVDLARDAEPESDDSKKR
ncbi:chitin-binding type-2 domain-containing protein [Trichonephila inaurata madagascariensis]|uniref:Chitin-binding type-2 domain-containing protein n=1 Tax=Trichonephila inaurata madagascariensis TaxID=2747483 RepID=A0A8X7BSJ9_9ARAC|nr:chitin-binding type-2 domain-containing protein [Trichonephila inaurata madagascariensis]